MKKIILIAIILLGTVTALVVFKLINDSPSEVTPPAVDQGKKELKKEHNQVTFGVPFELRIGNEVKFAGMTLKLGDVNEDLACPHDKICEQGGGEIIVKVSVKDGERELGTFDISQTGLNTKKIERPNDIITIRVKDVLHKKFDSNKEEEHVVSFIVDMELLDKNQPTY